MKTTIEIELISISILAVTMALSLYYFFVYYNEISKGRKVILVLLFLISFCVYYFELYPMAEHPLAKFK